MSERQISRSYERELTERLSEHSSARNSGMLGRACGHISLRIQRLWDSICPLFLQQLTFTPKWNRRIYNEIMSRIAFERSKDNREHR